MSNEGKIEQKMNEIDTILAEIESGEIPLEEVVKKYAQAQKLARELRENLAKIENEIEILRKDFLHE